MAKSNIFLLPQEEGTNNVPVSTDRIVLIEDAELNGYQFDAVTRYTTNYGYRPTKHSVPSGNFVSDHVVKDPKRFALIGILSPHNVVIPQGRDLFGSVNERGDNVVDFSLLETVLQDAKSAAVDLTFQKRRELIDFADAKRLFTVILAEDIIANMLITQLSLPKTAETGDGFTINMAMSEIRIAPRTQIQPDIINEDARKLGGLGFLEIDE